MFRILLVDEVNGNQYNRFESEDLFTCEVIADQRKYDAPKGCRYEIHSELAEGLEEEINRLHLMSEMIPEEDLRAEVSKMIFKISEACIDRQITESENDKLVDMLR